MGDLPDLPVSTDNLPETVAKVLPNLWLALLICVLIAGALSTGLFVKRLYRRFGRSFYKSSDDFYGSSWDLSAPVVQCLVILTVLTIGAQLIGFEFGQKLSEFWPKLLAGLIIIIGAAVLASWINRSIRAYSERIGARGRYDDTLLNYSGSVIRYIILGVALLTALSQLGVAPASLLAVLGAMGLAIALAMQDTLKAVAAGFLLAIFRPFRLGDWVSVDGYEGEVSLITPFTTALNRVDNTKVVLTNDKVWSSPIINYLTNKERRLDLYFSVHYDTDLDTAQTILKDTTNALNLTTRPKQTWAAVHDLGDWAITLRLRVWTRSSDAVQARVDILKNVKEAFDQAGIIIPYPQQVEHTTDPMPSNTPRLPK